MTIEFLLDEPSFQAHHMPYIKNLGVLGIDASVRMVDPVQYEVRASTISTSTLRSSASASRRCRANSLRILFFLAFRRDRRARRISAGISDPAIDALVDQIVARQDPARTGDRLQGARPRDPLRPLLGSALVQGLALDRLLGHVRPPAQGKPKYARGIPETWWYDPAKAANWSARRVLVHLGRSRRGFAFRLRPSASPATSRRGKA